MATSPMPDPNMLLQLAQQRQRETNPALMAPSPNPVLNQARQQAQQQQPTTQIQHPEAGTQPPPLSPAQQRLNTLTAHKPALENVYGDITQSKLGQAHPILGKLLGGLAQIPATAADIGLSAVAPKIGGLIPGTSAQQAAKVQNNMGLIKEEGLQREQAARTGLLNEQAAAAHMTPATAEEAVRLDVPEGTMLTAAMRERLAQNKTTVQGRIDVGHEASETKKQIANWSNLTKEDIEQVKAETARDIAAGKAPPHIITVQADGKPHVMERDPQTHQYSVDRGQAPANYASMLPELLPTHTTQLTDPETGVNYTVQYNPKTQKFDQVAGVHETGQAGHQMFQGGAIEQMAPKVIADINANREILGNLGSYYKQWTSGTPVSDPKAAQLMTELLGFSAMQPAMHAFRSGSALEAFEKIIGGLAKNPDSVIASINGILATPEAFKGNVRQSEQNFHPGGQGGGQQPIVQHSASTGQYRYSTDGGKTWQPGQPPKRQ